MNGVSSSLIGQYHGARGMRFVVGGEGDWPAHEQANSVFLKRIDDRFGGSSRRPDSVVNCNISSIKLQFERGAIQRIIRQALNRNCGATPSLEDAMLICKWSLPIQKVSGIIRRSGVEIAEQWTF